MVETSPSALVTSDLDGNITYVSKRALELYKTDDEKDLLGKNAMELIAVEDQEKAMKNFNKTIKQGIVRDMEYNLIKKDGTRYPSEFNTSLIKDGSGKAIGLMAIIKDITIRKKAEERLKKSLKEKSVLLQEIHHRVKNNLQTMVSLLHLQSNQVTDKKIKEALKESEQRIHSMALVHEQLYFSKDLARINFNPSSPQTPKNK
jgi:PAS domain S-box-containing protein